MQRIASVFSQTAFTEESHVFGANGPKTRDWADVLFDYIVMKSNLHFIKDSDFARRNIQYKAQFGSNHIHVFLQSSVVTRRSNIRNLYNETYAIELFSNALHVGGMVTDALDVMTNDVQRIFTRYFEHNIAGIRIINNVRVQSVAPPESETNPFQGVFKRTVTIDIEWEEEFNYPMTEEWEKNHQAYKYSAGEFKEDTETDIFTAPV